MSSKDYDFGDLVPEDNTPGTGAPVDGTYPDADAQAAFAAQLQQGMPTEPEYSRIRSRDLTHPEQLRLDAAIRLRKSADEDARYRKFLDEEWGAHAKRVRKEHLGVHGEDFGLGPDTDVDNQKIFDEALKRQQAWIAAYKTQEGYVPGISPGLPKGYVHLRSPLTGEVEYDPESSTPVFLQDVHARTVTRQENAKVYDNTFKSSAVRRREAEVAERFMDPGAEERQNKQSEAATFKGTAKNVRLRAAVWSFFLSIPLGVVLSTILVSQGMGLLLAPVVWAVGWGGLYSLRLRSR